MKPLDTLPMWQHNWVVANWKMNPTSHAAVSTLLDDFQHQWQSTDGIDTCNIIIAPSFVHLYQAKQAIDRQSLPVHLAAQNLCAKSVDKGAFTGEVSAAQLQDSGVSFVIIGHSERRQYFAEDNTCLAQKINCALAEGLTVIFCVGETQQQYEANQTQAVLAEQLSVINDINPTDVASRLIVAYEPVWAIGTGKVPTVEEVETIHRFIKQQLIQLKPSLTHTPILYGGSVNADNVADIAQCPHVSGVLVGGASLQATSFTQIIQAFAKK